MHVSVVFVSIKEISVRLLYCGKFIDGMYAMGGSVAEWLACWTQAQKGLFKS